MTMKEHLDLSGLPLIIAMILGFLIFITIWFTFLKSSKVEVITKSIVSILGILPITKMIEVFKKKP